jgi:hypothetical protein
MFFVCSIMNTHASISAEEALEAEGPLDPDGEREAQLLQVLARLTELGMVLAEKLVAQVTAEDVLPVDVGAVGGAFAKISRGVRMTVMLESKVLKERRLRLDGLEAAHEAKLAAMREARWASESAEAEAEEREQIEKRESAIEEAVKDMIRAERPEGYERERLFDRLKGCWKIDWSDYSSVYIDNGGEDALVSKQIAAFCQDLGLKPDWDLWKDSFWAVEEAEDEAEGSPYAAPATGPPDG